jgi:ABC-type multidrug transport system ATPase subunit
MPPLPGKAGLRRSITLAEIFSKKSKLSVGRAADCDLVLAHPLISRHHAELERLEDGRLRLTDLGSMNGITLGGQRLTGSSLVAEDVPVGIGPFMFSLIGPTIFTIDNSQGLRLEARGLEKTVPLVKGQSRKLLDNINLVIEPGEFVSVLGPSGSGKSTLMDCLNGRRRATGGQVLANGQDFYGHFDNFRQSLGYVPQKDIVHNQLTVARALYYTARLRLPTDTTARELESRMKDVIKLMELEPHSDTLVANLSGGQIKRVSLGAELLARPSLLYIDEATSGLDAGTEARMMKLFRSLADEGKSLICITHNVDNVDSCHLLIVLARGKLVYFGPPSEARTYFKVARVSEIYDRLAERDVDDWEKEYAGCSLHAEFVAKRLEIDPERGAGFESAETAGRLQTSPTGSDDYAAPPRSRFTPWWHQLKVLTQRYAELVLTDRRSLRLFVLQAPLIACSCWPGSSASPFSRSFPYRRSPTTNSTSSSWFRRSTMTSPTPANLPWEATTLTTCSFASSSIRTRRRSRSRIVSYSPCCGNCAIIPRRPMPSRRSRWCWSRRTNQAGRTPSNTRPPSSSACKRPCPSRT